MADQRRALITGIAGQDGFYLSELLLSKGYEVYGLARSSSASLNEYTSSKIRIIYGDIRDQASISSAIRQSNPDEIYNLAAQSSVGHSFKFPEETFEINYLSLGLLVKEAMLHNSKIKIYQASSSEMFGNVLEIPQKETTPFNPVSPYAESKVKAYTDFVVTYREKHGLFICSGILFNHESPRRGAHFVTKKIVRSMVRIKLGLETSFEVGNIDVSRDWGYAKDYVEAMWLMLQQEHPQDFVVASGESYTIRDFITKTANILNMNISWHGEGVNEVVKDATGNVILKINPEYYRPAEVNHILGDNSKIISNLGWRPKTSLDDIIAIMVEAELQNNHE